MIFPRLESAMAGAESKLDSTATQPVSSQPALYHTDQDVVSHGAVQIKCQEPAKEPRKGFIDLMMLEKP